MSIVTQLILIHMFTFSSGNPHNDYTEFVKRHNGYAGGPTGYFAIQHMLPLNYGETAYLKMGKTLDATKWTKEKIEDSTYLKYTKRKAILFQKGKSPVDLLTLAKKSLVLDNGLSMRVSFTKKVILKVWLYNPDLPRVKSFKGLPYFPFSEKGIVDATFTEKKFEGVTFIDSRDQPGLMQKIGLIHFAIGKKQYEFPAYTYQDSKEELSYLLLLFRDKTSGVSSYSGGRVIDIHFEKGKPPKKFKINFNLAYNLLCVHSTYYNCPIALTKKIDAPMSYGEKYIKSQK